MKPEQTAEGHERTPDQTMGYEPPRVEDVPSEDGPAVTAAGNIEVRTRASTS